MRPSATKGQNVVVKGLTIHVFHRRFGIGSVLKNIELEHGRNMFEL